MIVPSAIPSTPKKIAIIGCPGSGKTTLAQQLSAILNLPLYHLDQHCWQSGWQKTPEQDFVMYHQKLCATNAWIIDGNQLPTLASRCAQADLIIVFNLPRWRCIAGIINRWFFARSTQRNDLAPGCFDELNKPFLWYAWQFHKRYQPLLNKAAAQSNATRVELRTTQDIKNLVTSVFTNTKL